jgi:adenylate cyclase
MADENYKRKLTAILSADVAGYSRLMGDDEVATVSTLKSYRELITEKVQSFNGRVVDSPGDNILSEFRSIVDAVKCAVAIQEGLRAENEKLPENRKMNFRIGVNLGDVIQDGNRIYGDGVNIAARIEGLSDPGGVAISGTAFDNVRNKLDCGYQFSGEHAVKNIANPVRVYKILTDPECAGKVLGEKRFLGRMSRRVAMASILSLAIIAGGMFSYYIYLHQSGRIEPASIDKMAFPLPDEHSIAVLPFANMSGDPQQDYFSDGFTEQLITNLSMVPNLFVIARNSSFSFKGKAVKVQQVAEELGVRYVLEGSIQKADERVRINAQLIDAISGRHVWAEKYDRQLKDIFALQDDITLKIISEVGAEVTRGERARINAIGTTNVDAYIKATQGWEYFYAPTRETNRQARKLAEEAIAIDPGYQNAYCLLGITHSMDVFLGTSKSPQKSFETAINYFQKVLAVDENHPVARSALAYVYGMQRKYEQALAQAQQAIESNPGRANTHFVLGSILYFTGRYEEALQTLKKVIRLDPKGPAYYYLAMGHAYRGLGQYEEAIASYKKAFEGKPNYWMPRIFLAATYNMSGQEEMARTEADEVLRINPKFSLEKLAKSLPYKDKDYLNRAIEGMRKAGLK